jgi:hypothetical protein
MYLHVFFSLNCCYRSLHTDTCIQIYSVIMHKIHARNTCKIHAKHMQIHAQKLRDSAVHICMYLHVLVCIMYVFWGECISNVSVCISMHLSHGALLHPGVYLNVSECICMYYLILYEFVTWSLTAPWCVSECVCMYPYVLYVSICICHMEPYASL